MGRHRRDIVDECVHTAKTMSAWRFVVAMVTIILVSLMVVGMITSIFGK